jgi:hypothetical protein
MADTITTSAYGLTLGDHIRYVVLSYYRNLIRWPAGAYQLGMMLVTTASLSISPLLHGDMHAAAQRAGGVVAFWLLAIPAISIFSVWRIVRKTANATAPRSVRFDEDGVQVFGDNFDIRYAWAQFRRVDRDRKHLYLVIRPQGAFIVPTQAFASPEEASTAYGQARTHIRNAQHKQIRTFYSPVAEVPPSLSPQEGVVSPPYHLTFALFVSLYLRTALARIAGVMCLSALGGLVLSFVLDRHRFEVLDITTELSIWLPVIGILAVLPFIFMPVSWLIARRQPSAQGERHIILTPDHVRQAADSHDIKLIWKQVRKIVMTRGTLLFYIPRGIIAMPVNAFASRDEVRTFYERAVAYWQAAK